MMQTPQDQWARPSDVRIAWDILFHPAGGLKRIGEKDGLAPAIRIYAVSWLLTALFLALKPPDFGHPWPEHSPLPEHGILLSWMGTAFFGTLAMAVWIPFLGGFINLFRSGRILFKLPLATFWWGLPLFMILLYGQGKFSRFVFMVSWILPILPLLFSIPSRPLPWRPMTATVCASSAISLVLLGPAILSFLIKYPPLYIGSQLVEMVWTLGVVSQGLRFFCEISLPRAFLSFFFSLPFPIFFIYAMHFLGLVPSSMLKILFMP